MTYKQQTVTWHWDTLTPQATIEAGAPSPRFYAPTRKPNQLQLRAVTIGGLRVTPPVLGRETDKILRDLACIVAEWHLLQWWPDVSQEVFDALYNRAQNEAARQDALELMVQVVGRLHRHHQQYGATPDSLRKLLCARLCVGALTSAASIGWGRVIWALEKVGLPTGEYTEAACTRVLLEVYRWIHPALPASSPERRADWYHKWRRVRPLVRGGVWLAVACQSPGWRQDLRWLEGDEVHQDATLRQQLLGRA